MRVNYVEKLCKRGRHLGKILCASSADDHNVDIVRHFCGVVHMKDLCTADSLYAAGVTSCKYTDKLHIGSVIDRVLNTATEISVSRYSYFHNSFSSLI